MPSQDELKVLIKAYDEFTATFQRYQQQLRGVAQAQQKTGRESAQTAQQVGKFGTALRAGGKSLNDFYYLLGSIGAFYIFGRGLQQITNTTREFEATITQAKLIVGDMTPTLENAAMAAQGSIFGPQQLAEMYRELGAAGLSSQEVIQATPDTLDFATAAMIDQVDAARAVIAAVKSFGLTFEDTQRITDAFTEAMNRTTLGGNDLVLALASVGSVAGQAGQSLEQTLAAVAALKDTGASAQDAATSVRNAIRFLIAPTDEAKKTMKALGIEIWDASGNMKQWGDIVAEIEKAMVGLTKQQQEELKVALVGADGMRALSASLAQGSTWINKTAQAFADAEGTTKIFASTMADTLDGAIRQTTGNLQRATLTMSQDMTPVIRDLIDWINAMAVGFTNLDENSRKVAEGLLGAGGIAVAAVAIMDLVKRLTAELKILGITAAALTSPWALLIAAVGGVTTAFVGYGIQQAAATEAQKEHITQVEASIPRIQQLMQQYENLAGKTERTTGEEELLKQVTKELTDLVPMAITGFDEMGNAITDMGTATRATREEMERLKAEVASYYKMQAAVAEAALPQLRKEQQEAYGLVTQYQQMFKAPSPRQELLAIQKPHPTWMLTYRMLTLSDEEAQQELRKVMEQEGKRGEELRQQIGEYENALKIWKEIQSGEYWKPKKGPAPSTTGAPSGGRHVTLPGAEGAKAAAAKPQGPTWMQTWQADLQSYLDIVSEFGIVTTRASEKVDLLSARQQYLTRMIESGKGGVAEMIDLETTRAQAIDALVSHQARLSDEADAYRRAIANLEKRQENLNLLFAEGKITQDDYTQASRTLSAQTENFNRQIAANSQVWWQNEQAILDAKLAAERMAETQLSTVSGLLRQVYSWEEKQAVDHYRKMYEAQEAALEAQIEALEEASAQEIHVQQQIDDIEAQVAAKRRQRDEETEKRRLEQLRGQLESSRMVVVEQGMRRVTHDMEKERELQDAEAEATYNAEVQRLEDLRDSYQDELNTLQDNRERKRQQLEQELRDMQANHQEKLDALQEYYDAMAQDTILRQQAQLAIEQQGYDQSKAAYEQYLKDMEQLRAKSAVAALTGKGISVSSVTGGGGGGGVSASYKGMNEAERIGGGIARLQKSWQETQGESAKEWYHEQAEELRQEAASKGITEEVEEARKETWKGLQTGGLVTGFTYAALGERGAEVVLPLEKAVPVLGEALLRAMDQASDTNLVQGRITGPTMLVIQGAVSITTTEIKAEAENIDNTGRNLVIEAQDIYLQTRDTRPKVDTLAQMGYRR